VYFIQPIVLDFIADMQNDQHKAIESIPAMVDEASKVSKRKRQSADLPLVIVLDEDATDTALPISSGGETPNLGSDPPRSSLLKELAAERRDRERNKLPAPIAERTGASSAPYYKVLTYNVWFEESVCMTQRMAAIGQIIYAEQADFVFLQEVTPNIEHEFTRADWFAHYASSGRPPGGMPYYTLLLARRETVSLVSPFRRAPFPKSQMGRDLVSVCGAVRGRTVLAATRCCSPPPASA
jgi:hypothetical protein